MSQKSQKRWKLPRVTFAGRGHLTAWYLLKCGAREKRLGPTVS
jgi:hypothetical protein